MRNFYFGLSEIIRNIYIFRKKRQNNTYRKDRKKAGDDILRASTRCPPERLLTDAIKASHPNAKQREKCFDFVSCIPQEACLGKNRCEKEYLHEELNCKTYDSKVSLLSRMDNV